MQHLAKPRAVLAHGWAYTPQFFEPWLSLLATDQPHLFEAMEWYLLDAGYSQQTRDSLAIGSLNIPCLLPADLPPVLQDSDLCVGIGHSMGFASLLEYTDQTQKNWAHLLSLNGFTHFTSHHVEQPGTALRVLERMLRRARQDLPAVVHEFQTRCGRIHSEPWNTDALLEGLQHLMTLDTQTTLQHALTHGTRLHCIHNQDDAIVSNALTHHCFASVLHPVTLPGSHSDLMVTPHRYTSSVSAVVNVLQQALTTAQGPH